MTALYLTSLDLQTSASLRFLGTFISGALPEKLTTPLMVAVPIAPSLPAGGVAPVVVGLGPAPEGLVGSSEQPTPMANASEARAASEARSRRCMRRSSVP